MRGLRLLVRPSTPDDQPGIEDLYRQEAAGQPDLKPLSVVGKLLGRIVAHAAAEPAGDTFRISTVIVAKELRRRRIGSTVVSELEKVAAESGATALAVTAGKAAEFFQALGFIVDDEMFRKVLRARE